MGPGRNPARRRAAVVPSMVLACLLAGCNSSKGSGGGSSAGTGGSSPGASSGGSGAGGTSGTDGVPSQKAIHPEEDKKLAQTLVLGQPDFSSTWTFSPHANDSASVIAVTQTCLGMPDPGHIDTAIESGPDAASGSLSVQSNAVLVTTSTVAANQMAALRGSSAQGCIRASVAGLLPADPGIAVSVGSLKAPTSSGVASAGFRIIAGSTYIDVIEIQHERAITTVTLRSQGGPFPADMEDGLVGKVADRTGRAVTG